MSLFYITGIAGSGKSAVCEELKARGYETHEADATLSAYYENATGKLLGAPPEPALRTVEWRALNTWKMSKNKLLALKATADTKPVFVCGVAANEDEYLDVFSKVFALHIDSETLKQRLRDRQNNSFGKLPHELEAILEWHQGIEDNYRKVGAHVIDATKPLPQVVDEILANLP